jgi:hypothetical protein
VVIPRAAVSAQTRGEKKMTEEVDRIIKAIKSFIEAHPEIESVKISCYGEGESFLYDYRMCSDKMMKQRIAQAIERERREHEAAEVDELKAEAEKVWEFRTWDEFRKWLNAFVKQPSF